MLTEHQLLTDDELLHLAEERNQLTDNACVSLDAEISRRRLSPSDIDSYKRQHAEADKADKLRRATPQLLPAVGLGKKFFGKANRRRDPSGLFEHYETTLWFIVLWFPVFPIASYTVRRELERWLGMVVPSDAVALERHPRNWEQILLTWAKVASLLLAFRLAFFLLIGHPEWLKHLG